MFTPKETEGIIICGMKIFLKPVLLLGLMELMRGGAFTNVNMMRERIKIVPGH